MFSLNRATIIGNATRDPEMRYTPNGQAVCSFGVATNRRWTDRNTGEMQEQVEFHDIVAWGKLAENISQMVNSSLEVDEVLRIAMDTVIRMINAERGFLMLRDSDNEMIIRTARNWEQESINSKESSTSRTIITRVIESGESILTTDAQEDPRFGAQESIIAHNMRSILCVPLKVKNELIGVIYADNRIRSGIFTEASRNVLATFANQVAIAIENARLFTSLRHTLA
ncbi:single-stranded DNA-binding protein, partial [bacterium]|nr:single-stranded DNA-binding protein [bacterium]